ncbi:MAG: hypothetical protein RUMPE_01302 [Eubacteriales bacterium SKADARSKE-1]|nr:hypothetical protein [Eubacteriales bacterium SKADARSKE-1]
MKNYLSKIELGSAKLAFNAAKTAAGNASHWMFFQPQEPKMLKELKDKNYKK